jgi:hypothetical protein
MSAAVRRPRPIVPWAVVEIAPGRSRVFESPRLPTADFPPAPKLKQEKARHFQVDAGLFFFLLPGAA